MTRDEQAAFVTELTASVNKSIIERIVMGAIPAHWNGIQLRQYMTDCYQESTLKMFGKDKREYEKDKLANNL